MNQKVKHFVDLHHQNEPLLIGNVWNAQSAKVFEKQNFKAIATSSYAVAETLGYADGEQMTFDEYFNVIRYIVKATSLPLSVDLESGYGETAAEVAANIKKLVSIGVVGVNIEDTFVRDGKRVVIEANAFAEKIKNVISILGADVIFINLRTDAFLLKLDNAREEALKRIAVYNHIGAHGLFLPFISSIADIELSVAASKLPLNVLATPELADFASLQRAGVKRISMGNWLNSHIYQKLDEKVAQIVTEASFSPLFV